MKKRGWLIILRKELGLTQQKVADMCEITQQVYGMYENGKRCPCPRIAKKIARVLGFDWTKFYD